MHYAAKLDHMQCNMELLLPDNNGKDVNAGPDIALSNAAVETLHGIVDDCAETIQALKQLDSTQGGGAGSGHGNAFRLCCIAYNTLRRAYRSLGHYEKALETARDHFRMLGDPTDMEKLTPVLRELEAIVDARTTAPAT